MEFLVVLIAEENGVVSITSDPGETLESYGWENIYCGAKETIAENRQKVSFIKTPDTIKVLKIIDFLNNSENDFDYSNSLMFLTELPNGGVFRLSSSLQGVPLIFEQLGLTFSDSGGEWVVSHLSKEQFENVSEALSILNKTGYLRHPEPPSYSEDLEVSLKITPREILDPRRVLDNKSLLAGVNFWAFKQELLGNLIGVDLYDREDLDFDDEDYSHLENVVELEDNVSALKGFKGSLEELRNIPTSELNVVSRNWLPGKAKKQLEGKGKTVQDRLAKMGIESIYDLLTHYPIRHIDKSNVNDFSYLNEADTGETVNIVGTIVFKKEMVYGRGGAIFVVKSDAGETIETSFFNQIWLLNKFNVGSRVLINGKISFYRGRLSITGSSIDTIDDVTNMPVVPIYRQSRSNGITTNFLLSAIKESLSLIDEIHLPPYIKKRVSRTFKDSISKIHLPRSSSDFYSALNELSYYEMLYMQIVIQNTRMNNEGRKGISLTDSLGLCDKAVKCLPFTLTGAQRKAIEKIGESVSSNTPSSTLLNADVGAGKTIVAQLSALKAIGSGFQAVLVAPTEILAKQLYLNSVKLFELYNKTYGSNLTVGFLSSKLKAKEKKEMLKNISEGGVDLIVGTHTLFTGKVDFKNLGFIAIDEQQKFGAEQRSSLLSSRNDGLVPHLLMQTATPIPRSTAQVFYGDIDMILLDEKPPGRQEIETSLEISHHLNFLRDVTHPIWADIREEVSKGHQTFVITPLIYESDRIDASSVVETAEILEDYSLSGLRIGFVHGKMKQDEQDEIMSSFRDGNLDVLVASTVVEVGVDIPKATRVVILSAERLGASSLHQIRGRVGRNSFKSKCFLVANPTKSSAKKSLERLRSLVDSNDGFEIAKADLKLRGEGDIFGSNQSGRTGSMFISVMKNSGKVEEARNEALRILESPYRDKAIKDSMERYSIEENGRKI